MSERIRYELLLTGLSLVMGGWLMIVYDSLRLLRLLIHHNSLFMGMEDFFYWIYAGGAEKYWNNQKSVHLSLTKSHLYPLLQE